MPDRTVLVGGMIYDPFADSWKSAGHPPDPFFDATLLLDGRVLLGGVGGPQDQLYDPISQTLSVLTMGMARVTTLPDGRVLGFYCCPTALHGSDITPVTTRIYDPKLNVWTVGVPLPGAQPQPMPNQVTVMYSGDIFTTAPSPETYYYPVEQPVPFLTNASIDHADATSASILVTGTGFLPSSMVSINSQPAVTTFLGAGI